jgi:hypothetical protein
MGNKRVAAGRETPLTSLNGVRSSDVSIKRVNRTPTSRMANALHRYQTRLWRAGNRSLFPTVIGSRWMSKSRSPLSDIEVLSIFFLAYRFLMSVL